ncbi:MFS transporter [Brachybacterium ginsengisoli]|uniref:MFS transporter n=1 Tax=Brachybacterium ginsengisoli TaxID=1331682 RepID=A0A291GTG4_9MICO|nr:MFS transporter [Brachybacterium ginsengisoli]ATG53384.1 MFS transporter [Brachybacterium ginsengisoli]
MSRGHLPTWLAVAPTGFVLAWGGNHFTPLLHVYETVGGYAPWQANLLLGMYVVGLIPGMLLAAGLSDRHGRRPIAIIGLLAAALASVLLAASMTDFVLLCVGRVLAGIGVGVGMSVGSSWIKELSSAPHDPHAAPTAGARRSSMTLTLGFAIGAGVTGSLAQWAPLPGQLPFLVHLGLCLLAALALLGAPESLPRELRTRGALRDDLRVPSVGHPTFVRLVLPAGPWVFAAAGVAYAILPSTVEAQIGDAATIYATGLTVLTLGIGAIAQGAVGLIDRLTRGRALVVGMAGMSLGMILAAVAADLRHPAFVVGVAALLGASYGVCVVAGLVIAQSLATPRDLAGITGVYYSLAYLGFLLPTLLAALTPVLPYTGGLAIVAAVCTLCLATVAWGLRRPLPRPTNSAADEPEEELVDPEVAAVAAS